ncbi:MAG TPA: hypothetical protein VGF36_16700, partial [Rhodopila sp.]
KAAIKFGSLGLDLGAGISSLTTSGLPNAVNEHSRTPPHWWKTHPAVHPPGYNHSITNSSLDGRIELGRKVDITAGVGFIPSDGAKKRQMRDAGLPQRLVTARRPWHGYGGYDRRILCRGR